jgi:hypothetical protein
MAYVQDEELKRQQQMTPAGQVLAGSGGMGTGQSQARGAGWTNLQTYLGANQGNAGVAIDGIIGAGRTAAGAATDEANRAAKAWGDSGVEQANQGAKGFGDIQEAIKLVNTDGSDYGQAVQGVSQTRYTGPDKATGKNVLEQNYDRINKVVDNYGDFTTQKGLLSSQNNYATSWGALDAFLANRQGNDQIRSWQDQTKAGLKTGDQYTGIADNEARINKAISDGQGSIAWGHGQMRTALDQRRARDEAARRKPDPAPMSLPEPPTNAQPQQTVGGGGDKLRRMSQSYRR